MTIDHIQILHNDHKELKIKADKSILRRLLTRYRKFRGFYTKESELNESKILNKWLQELKVDLQKGDGVYCPSCMKERNPTQHRDAVYQLKGYATFE